LSLLVAVNGQPLRGFSGTDEEYRIVTGIFLNDTGGAVPQFREARLCKDTFHGPAFEAEVGNAGGIIVESAVFLVQVS
jgi:hypothetical protein